MTVLPETLRFDAWGGAEALSPVADDIADWAMRRIPAKDRELPAALVDRRDWRHPEVGWGIVLPEKPGLLEDAHGLASNAPAPIRALLAARAPAPVFRVGSDWRAGFLRGYDAEGRPKDYSVVGSKIGTGPGCVPQYLLIVGSPEDIPWEVQYDLQLRRFVGRLDLPSDGLARYVEALLGDWDSIGPSPSHTLGWSVDHGGGDITTTMRHAVGRMIASGFLTDSTTPELALGARFITGAEASHAALQEAIVGHRPSLIYTTSHGATMPLDDAAAMRAQLGLPVDADFTTADPAALASGGGAAGAIWYAHACCSAGSTGRSAFDGVLAAGSHGARVVSAVAACGDVTAPLPRALLGAQRPLRAFVGHVEPTFDWSIVQPETKQHLGPSLRETFHRNLFLGQPVGMALDAVRQTGAAFLHSYDILREMVISEDARGEMGRLLALQLAARDWRSIVLLGDPTCRIWSA